MAAAVWNYDLLPIRAFPLVRFSAVLFFTKFGVLCEPPLCLGNGSRLADCCFVFRERVSLGGLMSGLLLLLSFVGSSDECLCLP